MPINGKIKIVTFGDSLTQGNPPPHKYHPHKYQYWMSKKIIAMGIVENSFYDVNYGIGGQLMGEISVRIPNSLPADIISITGGTNDCWRYSDWDEELSKDMRNDVLEEMEEAINYARNGPNGNEIKIILCSVPPVLPGKNLGNMLKNIILLRDSIKELSVKHKTYFCDIYEAMLDKDSKGSVRSNLVIGDGVHFTTDGNQAFGEALGEKIVQIMKEN